MERLTVEILAGPNVGESYDFEGQGQVLIGRGSTCQLQLSSPHVSRQQCELHWQEGQVVLENLGTVNVTYLNDRPVERVYVQDGDLITFCDVAMRVRLPRDEATVAFSGTPAGPDASIRPEGEPTPLIAPRPPAPAGMLGSAPMPDANTTAPPAPPVPPPSQRPPTPIAASGPLPGPVPGVGSGQYIANPRASAVPPQQPPAYPLGMPGAPPSGSQGAMPAHPPPPMSAGMPGPPPGPAVAPKATGGAASKSSRKGGGRKKGGGLTGNLQLVRNLSLAVAGVVVLFCLAVVWFSPSNKGKGKGQRRVKAVATAPVNPLIAASPGVSRGDRTDEEILNEAERLFGVGERYLREYQIADENLATASEFMYKAQAQLTLVSKEKWPPFAAEIEVKLAKASQHLNEEFSKAKINYVREKQSGHYQNAMAEMERIERLYPDRSSERNQFARKQKRVLQRIMSGGKKGGPF